MFVIEAPWRFPSTARDAAAAAAIFSKKLFELTEFWTLISDVTGHVTYFEQWNRAGRVP